MQLKPLTAAQDSLVPMYVSVGVIAWNEADAIGTLLRSLLTQSLFRNLKHENRASEILVVANGCTDDTAQKAEAILQTLLPEHPDALAIRCVIVSLPERGKLNAWNQYVHSFSSKECRFLFLMDADIELRGEDTLWNMLKALRETPSAKVSVDIPVKVFPSHSGPKLGKRLSEKASQITAMSPGQITGQLYCIDAEAARKIYLPKDLSACDDGFIKALVCTDSLTVPLRTDRVCIAPGAQHLFEAYTSPLAILRNQKRQIIGQTIVHILVDQYLPTLSLDQRREMARVLREADSKDPDWLKRLIAGHISRRLPWQLYPSLLTHRLKRVLELPLVSRVTCLPAAVAHMLMLFLASVLAYRALKSGSTDYWPKAGRRASTVNPSAHVSFNEPNPPSKQLTDRIEITL